MIKKKFLWGEFNKMTKQFITDYIDSKMAENENFIRFTFYELRVKHNLSEEDTNEFLRLCMSSLDKKGYEVYIGNARYSYNNGNQYVQPNELLVAFKSDVK